MADDRIDWADVAAVGVMHLRYPVASVRLRVSELLGAPAYYQSDLEREHAAIAAALREAFEAGLRESCRELSARRAVDGWLREEHPDRYLYWAGTGWTAAHTDPETDEPEYDAHGADYPALAAALGLEVEDDG